MGFCYFANKKKLFILLIISFDMSCLNPILIRRLDTRTQEYVFQKVRCRTCEDCKQVQRSAAYVRMKYETDNCLKLKGMVFFFTLTFADEYVPFKFHRMCFDKKMVQDWLQQIRQEFRRKYGWRIKYFLVSEVGHVGTHRPHHHGLFFLYPDTKYQFKSWQEGGKNYHKIPILSRSYELIIAKMWQFGRCDISEFDPERGGIDYVSKYIAKDVEEENLFKDIITRIQIKRGKGNPALHVKYLCDTFPSLHAFMQRYTPFTMISQGVGSSAPITRDDCVTFKKIAVEGFDYNIPRYYIDRFVRKECMECVPVFTHVDMDMSLPYENYLISAERWTKRLRTPSNGLPYLEVIKKRCQVPNPYYYGVCLPSTKVLDKYKVYDDLFTWHYENVPIYVQKYVNNKLTKVKLIPKQSEASTINIDKAKYTAIHCLDIIEDRYFALPPLLQDSCPFNVPEILKAVPRDFYKREGEIWMPTKLYFDVLQSLDELTQVASDWRSRKRINDRENQRKQKMQKNEPYARRPLSWDEYKRKSLYFGRYAKNASKALIIV